MLSTRAHKTRQKSEGIINTKVMVVVASQGQRGKYSMPTSLLKLLGPLYFLRWVASRNIGWMIIGFSFNFFVFFYILYFKKHKDVLVNA